MYKKKNFWLSVYIYYDIFDITRFRKLLVEAVDPFIKDVLQKKLIQQFFFICYSEHGPHIRLRLKADNEIIEKELRPYLLTYFSNYLAKNPSIRQEQEEAKDWLPNNSIFEISYKPEIKRYGGSLSMLVAEEQFDISSRTVLSLLQMDNWSYEKALGYAIEMHVGLLYAMNMNKQAIIKFCSHIAHHNEKNIPLFKESFNKQKAILQPYITNLWKYIQNNDLSEKPYLQQWILQMRDTYKKLIDIQKRKKLHRSIPSLLESYVHMTNNRLRIFYYDEPFIAYIILECLKQL